MTIQKPSFLSQLKGKLIGLSNPSRSSNAIIKISVVIPTYNTDPKALDRLIKSVDAQTLPKENYEVLFIDDGSTDDTYNRLTKLASSRSNVVVKQISNSGWGSRPRNIATKMAKGVYVLYLDHDDTVFPEAFERVSNYGEKHQADVVNSKEIRTKGWSWGWDQFKENNPTADQIGIESLLPMTPHKFYRREFLLENEIEFNEGARVLWEDVYFNTKVFACGARVAILADYPAYHWIDTGVNTSKSFGNDPHEKWNQIRQLMQFFVETLKNEEDLNFMLTHWYQSRVLGILGPWLLDKSESRIAVEFGYAGQVAADLIPISLDTHLTPINKVRAYFLRQGNIEALKRLAHHEKDVTARSYASNIEWMSGKLVIESKAEMTFDEKLPYMLHVENGQLLRYIPIEIQEVIPADLLDVRDDVDEVIYEASIKARDSRVTWEVPVEESEVTLQPVHTAEVVLTGKLKAAIDITNAAKGEKLDRQPWDIATRFSALGYTIHRGIVAPKEFMAAALIDGTTAVAYCNKSDLLSLDIGSKVHSVVAASHPETSDLTFKNEGNETKVILALPKIHTFGSTEIKGEIHLQPVNTHGKKIAGAKVKTTAKLIGDEQGARVEAKVTLLQNGLYELTTRFENRTSDTRLILRNTTD